MFGFWPTSDLLVAEIHSLFTPALHPKTAVLQSPIKGALNVCLIGGSIYGSALKFMCVPQIVDSKTDFNQAFIRALFLLPVNEPAPSPIKIPNDRLSQSISIQHGLINYPCDANIGIESPPLLREGAYRPFQIHNY